MVGFMVIWLSWLGPSWRQNILAESTWWSKATHLMVTRRQRGRGRGPGTRSSLQGHVMVTYFSRKAPPPLASTTTHHSPSWTQASIAGVSGALQIPSPGWLPSWPPKAHALTFLPDLGLPVVPVRAQTPRSACLPSAAGISCLVWSFPPHPAPF